MEFYNGIFSSEWQFAALAFCALLIGFSKTGIQGAVVVSIPMMALAFGAKESTGVILPMLCFADLIAVAYYRRDADWRLVLKLLPSAVVGFFAALVADSFVSGRGFGVRCLRRAGSARRKSQNPENAQYCLGYLAGLRQ